MSLPVLFLDNHLLVVDKPAGMLSQGDRTGDLDVLSAGKAFLKERFNKPGNVFLGLVHRLDRPASGVMVLARTSKAARRLAEQFRHRTVDKEYLAIVEGDPGGSGSWQDWLVKRGRMVSRVERGTAEALEARLAWEAVDSQGGQTLVRVHLETGRPHQIRVQFAERGHPLIGDLRYGATAVLDGRNLALHCRRLALDHPIRKERAQWVSPPPETWPAKWRGGAS